MIYLDNAATTAVSPAVLEAMLPYLKEEFGNPGSIHAAGRAARQAVEKARERVAAFLNASPEQIIFTSGGSESNTTVFRSMLPRLWHTGLVNVAVSETEHDSVLNAVAGLRKMRDITLSMISPDASGVIQPGAVERVLDDPDLLSGTGLVSVMAVNNETGAENDVTEIARLCHDRSALFHTDCVQAASCVPLDVKHIDCDFLSMSSHKIHGPKGTGALYVKDKTIISSTIFGGSNQEFGLRGGTENVPGIVGFGVACQLMQENLARTVRHTSVLKQLFVGNLRTELEQADLGGILHVNGGNLTHPGRIVNLRIDGVDGETLVVLLDSRGVCVSSGSACRSNESEPSRVLLSMGIDPEDARNSVRVSFSDLNTEEEVREAAGIFASCISLLRHGE